MAGCIGCGANTPTHTVTASDKNSNGPMYQDPTSPQVPGYSKYSSVDKPRWHKQGQTNGFSADMWDYELFMKSGSCHEVVVEGPEGSTNTCDEFRPCEARLVMDITFSFVIDGEASSVPSESQGDVVIGFASDSGSSTKRVTNGTKVSETIEYEGIADVTYVSQDWQVSVDFDAGCGNEAFLELSFADFNLEVGGIPTPESADSAIDNRKRKNQKIRFDYYCDQCQGQEDLAGAGAQSVDAIALWDEVKASYPYDDLISLTNIRDRSQQSISDPAGYNACQSVIDLWPIYAQADFDITNRKHVETGKFAVLSLLWRRGGTATTVAKVEWDEVWGADGMITRLRNTSVRGRVTASSNSDVVSSRRDSDGTKKRGWSDPQSLPTNFLPTDRSAVDE